jgi:hypothetical protein
LVKMWGSVGWWVAPETSMDFCIYQGQSRLNFWHLTTYIYMSYRIANLQTLYFKYLLNKYTYWIF